MSSILTELVPKRLEHLREIVPKAAALGALVNPNYPDVTLQLRELQVLAKTTSQQIQSFRAGTEPNIDAAFATFAQLRIDALIVANDPFFESRRNQIIALAARHGLPAIYSGREYVTAGGLISFGPNLIDAFRQAGVYTSRILKGVNPADLPVLQLTKFELLVNLKTAKALGITISETFLLRADEVIE